MTKENLEIIKTEVFKQFQKTDRHGNEADVNTYKEEVTICCHTDDRGPRTDHGGGEDGDGWMSSEQIARCAAPYEKKYQPKIDSVVSSLRKLGFDTRGHVEYGEKGHIMIMITAK